MTLDDVIRQRQEEKPLDREQLKSAVEKLLEDIRNWVAGLPFELQEWNVLIKYVDAKMNLPSVTIHFNDDQVTVLPRSFIVGRRPQVEVSSGARVAILEHAGEAGWIYSWEGTHTPPEPLTKDSFRDEILAGLLR